MGETSWKDVYPFSIFKNKTSAKIKTDVHADRCARFMSVGGYVIWFEIECACRKHEYSGYEHRCDYSRNNNGGLFICKNKECPAAVKYKWWKWLEFNILQFALLYKAQELLDYDRKHRGV